MIIDFHTHMFPDKIAGRTLDYLSGSFWMQVRLRMEHIQDFVILWEKAGS